jgi:hypothetical protein
MVKSGPEFFILKFSEPLQRYLLTCQANSAILGRFFALGSSNFEGGSLNFKIKKCRPLFTIIFKSTMLVSRLEILVIKWVLVGVVSGWAGWDLAHSKFLSSVNPIQME